MDIASAQWDWAAGLLEMLSDGNTLYVPGVGQWDGEEWICLLPDGLGSVRQLADSSGHVVQRYDYSPFGQVLAAEGTRTSALQYTGEHWDGDAGLLYLRARWYDPATGRFLTRDPFPGLVGLPQTQHPYVYAGNNPVNLTDPSGEIAETPWDLVMVGLDLAIFAWDIYYYTTLNPCADHWEAIGVLGLDVAAIGLDVICLLVPILPGGWGTGLRLAGGGTAVLAHVGAHVPQAARVGQAAIKATQIVHFARRSSGGTGERGSGGRTSSSYSNDWHKGTFPAPEASAQYHYRKHGGPWRSIEEYTRAAKQFYADNPSLARPHRLRTGEVGVKIRTKQYFGIYTNDGRIVTFGGR